MVWEWRIEYLNYFTTFTTIYACFSISEYFNSCFFNGTLMNDIGTSSLSSFFYNKIPDIVCSEA